MLETASDTYTTALAETLVRSWREEQNGVIALPGTARQTVDFRLFLSELRDQTVASSGSTATPSLTFTSVAMPVPFAVASDLGILIHQLMTDAMACARTQARGGRIAVRCCGWRRQWGSGVASVCAFLPLSAGCGVL
jgi:hypothetical protein